MFKKTKGRLVERVTLGIIISKATGAVDAMDRASLCSRRLNKRLTATEKEERREGKGSGNPELMTMSGLMGKGKGEQQQA